MFHASRLLSFEGEIFWHDTNPDGSGAWSQDFVLNRKLELTALTPPVADQLNQLPDGACGDGSFTVGEIRDIIRAPCAPLKFFEGSAFVIDHDFIYVREDMPNMLFTGGKHVGGSGFTTPETSPMFLCSNHSFELNDLQNQISLDAD